MLSAGINEKIRRHTPAEGFNETSIPGLRLYRRSESMRQRMPVIYDPSICVISQGSKRLWAGERTLTYDACNYLISALTLPIEAEIEEASSELPFLGFVLRFEPVSIGRLLAEIDDLVEWPVDPPQQVICPCPMSETLTRPLERLLGCLDDETDRQVLAESLVREILYSVLRGPRGDVLREQTLRGSRAHRVARAVAFVEHHYHEPIDIHSIARHAAMSPSALHQHFKELTALSPMQYVQRLRLHRARALLLGGQGAAEAGYSVGYNSPSQFSREFRRLFGVPPSQAVDDAMMTG